jgi:hypothetical protein
VQDDEQVVRVFVQLRPLVARHDVLDVEGVKVEVLGEPGTFETRRLLDLQPAQIAVGEGLYLRLSALSLRRDDAMAPESPSTQPWPGNDRHLGALR